jgi:thiamine pyrophosphate-dependent acetolactate synthase large subunit-like protein
MTMAELETAVREKAKVIAIVFDNERYGTIRMHQDRRGDDAAIATDLGSMDFAAIARACGARGIRVETDGAFEQALRQALANDRPTVIQLALDRGWVHPDEPFGGATRIPGLPCRRPPSRRKASSTARRERTRWSRPPTAITVTIRGRSSS